MVAQYDPAGQSALEVEPLKQYEPSVQFVHEGEPATLEYFPTGHAVQCTAAVDRFTDVYPASHANAAVTVGQ